MKKRLLVLLMTTTVAVLTACGDKKAETADTAAPSPVAESVATPESLSSEELSDGAEIANPFVPVEDDMEFSIQLGIDIDTSKMWDISDKYICNDSFAEVDFESSDMDGNLVKWTLRATTDEEAAESLHGLNYDLGETQTIEFKDMGISLNYNEVPDADVKLYTWTQDDTYYTLTVEGGDLSQMQVAEILDGVFAATGNDPTEVVDVTVTVDDEGLQGNEGAEAVEGGEVDLPEVDVED